MFVTDLNHRRTGSDQPRVEEVCLDDIEGVTDSKGKAAWTLSYVVALWGLLDVCDVGIFAIFLLRKVELFLNLDTPTRFGVQAFRLAIGVACEHLLVVVEYDNGMVIRKQRKKAYQIGVVVQAIDDQDQVSSRTDV